MSLRVIMFEGEDTDKLLSDLISNVEYLKLDVGVYELDKLTHLSIVEYLFVPKSTNKNEVVK